MYVNSAELRKARSADLYRYLIENHPAEFRKEGLSLRMICRGGISIKQGYYGYSDFSNGETGNGIDFLMRYLGYSFQKAVIALSAAAVPAASPCVALSGSSSQIELPTPAPFPHSRMFGFLVKRGIPGDVIARFTRQGLIYQTADHNNIAFVNKERDYCELRGSYTYAQKPFHGCIKARPDRFWYFTGNNSKPHTAYVTEAAIDAISLWLLQREEGHDTADSVYISIGGAANHSTIDRIKRGIKTILAVDNDDAGEKCRQHHNELEYIIPVRKDWNEDLQHIIGTKNDL